MRTQMPGRREQTTCAQALSGHLSEGLQQAQGLRGIERFENLNLPMETGRFGIWRFMLSSLLSVSCQRSLVSGRHFANLDALRGTERGDITAIFAIGHRGNTNGNG